MNGHILAIDQGTTSTRSIVFDAGLLPVATAQTEFRQIFPEPGWVEHDPEDIWRTTVATARDALAKASLAPATIAAIGLTNQRETTLVWSRATGKPVYNAIVWQDRRTSQMCAQLRSDGHEPLVAERTGLVLDPYFSATKIAWILDAVPGARAAAERGELAFGTVDTFLLWRLTDGHCHKTDATNASRTLLLNIQTGDWDNDLLRLFRIPRSMLPQVCDCAAEFGVTDPEHFGMVLPIRGIAGDQQAALVGQGCFRPGMVKSTYGTGCFMLLNIGAKSVASRHKLLTTIGYQLKGRRTYALEGAIFSAGATVQWLRDGLGIIDKAAQTDGLAAAADTSQRVYLVPAFTGLGAPYWDSDARGSISGITRGTTTKELARAALESVGFQTRDLLEAMRADAAAAGLAPANDVIRVDGGMSASDWTMQFLADMLNAPVDRPAVLETTARGAAYLAGWQSRIYPEPEEFARTWNAERRFAPSMPRDESDARYAGWLEAVGRTASARRA